MIAIESATEERTRTEIVRPATSRSAFLTLRGIDSASVREAPGAMVTRVAPSERRDPCSTAERPICPLQPAVASTHATASENVPLRTLARPRMRGGDAGSACATAAGGTTAGDGTAGAETTAAAATGAASAAVTDGAATDTVAVIGVVKKPSLAATVKLSVPVNPAAGVYVKTEPACASVPFAGGDVDRVAERVAVRVGAREIGRGARARDRVERDVGADRRAGVGGRDRARVGPARAGRRRSRRSSRSRESPASAADAAAYTGFGAPVASSQP